MARPPSETPSGAALTDAQTGGTVTPSEATPNGTSRPSTVFQFSTASDASSPNQRGSDMVSVFECFGLPLEFELSEEVLRDRYFQACREHANSPQRLAQLHVAYQTLHDPVRRLRALCEASQLVLPSPEEQIPPDLLGFYEILSTGTSTDQAALLSQLTDEIQTTERQISDEFRAKNAVELSRLAARLTYLRRFQSETFQGSF